MPNADYSYAGWNPGAGMQDFAQTMRQGYLDQQALKQQQYENLLKGSAEEAEHGPMSGQSTVDPEVLSSNNLNAGVQQLANTAQNNRQYAPIMNSQTGQYVNPPPQGSPRGAMSNAPPPAALAKTPQAAAAQAGVASPTSPADLQNNDATPGPQSDGSFVAKNGAVIPHSTYVYYQQRGAEVDPDTGRITMSNHDATVAYQEHNKTEAALAALGSRMMGSATSPIKTEFTPQPHAGGGSRPGQMSTAEKQDLAVYQGALKARNSPDFLTLAPDQREKVLSNIANYESQISSARAGNAPAAHGAPTGAGPSPSNQPKTVIQNGHTYTLNPQTGKYE